MTEPYIPGFLAFREVNFLLERLDDVKTHYPHIVPQVSLLCTAMATILNWFVSCCRWYSLMEMECYILEVLYSHKHSRKKTLWILILGLLVNIFSMKFEGKACNTFRGHSAATSESTPWSFLHNILTSPTCLWISSHSKVSRYTACVINKCIIMYICHPSTLILSHCACTNRVWAS